MRSSELILKAAELENNFPAKRLEIPKKIAGWILIGIGLVLLYFKFSPVNIATFSIKPRYLPDVWLGAGMIVAAVFLVLELWSRFILYFREFSPTTLPSDVIISVPLAYIDFETARLIKKTPDFFPETILETALFNLDFGKFLLFRLGFSVSELLPRLRGASRRPSDIVKNNSVESLLQAAAGFARGNERQNMSIGDVFLAATSLSPIFTSFLTEKKLEPKDLDYLIWWYETEKKYGAGNWTEEIGKSAGIGKTWHYAYTLLLDKFSDDIEIRETEESHLHFLGHKKEVLMLEEALLKSAEANAMLVGEPGVGKMTVIEGLVKRIREGRSSRTLNYKRVVKLNLNMIFGQTSFGDTIGLLNSILKEAERAGNIIIVIDDIQNFLVSSSKTNISEMLIPFLKSTAVKIIGLTDRYGFERITLENPVIPSLFERIDILEPDEKNTMKILEDIACFQERKYGLILSYGALKKDYELADQYLTESVFPEKAINFLDDVFVYVLSIKNTPVILWEHVEEVLERKIQMPVGEMEKGEKEKLMNLETELHKRIIGQEEAITAIANAMRRARTGLKTDRRPVGNFLFLGSTGVGKTETAKALAEIYFGSEERMLRLDMSEYQKVTDISRLIGSVELKEPGHLSSLVHKNPFSLLLLDEIEKAHPDILNLFLQVFDEAYFTDAFGKKADFRNIIIIATSNAGAEFIRENLGADIPVPYEKLEKMLVEKILHDAIFRPEFVNRFDGVIIFRPLSQPETKKVAGLLLKKLGERIKKQGYELEISEETLERLASASAGSVFGARELRRLIQDTVESPLAKDILAEKYKKGEIIKI